jgi:hypothetical protein
LRLTQAYQLGELFMSKLLNIALAAALGFAVSAPLYAADTSQASQAKQTTAMSDAEARAAMDKCNNLTGTAHAKCIVNIRPAGGGGSSLAVGVGGSSAERNTVKDGTATAAAEYSAAVKECESVDAADKDRCVNTAKEHFGRYDDKCLEQARKGYFSCMASATIEAAKQKCSDAKTSDEKSCKL